MQKTDSGILNIFLKSINEWIDNRCICRLFNRNKLLEIPKGTYREELDKSWLIANNTDKDWIILRMEVED